MPSALRFWHIMFSFYIAVPQVLSDYPRWLKLLRNCLQLLMRWPTIDREKTRDTIIVRVSKRMNQNMLNNDVIVRDVYTAQTFEMTPRTRKPYPQISSPAIFP